MAYDRLSIEGQALYAVTGTSCLVNLYTKKPDKQIYSKIAYFANKIINYVLASSIKNTPFLETNV